MNNKAKGILFGGSNSIISGALRDGLSNGLELSNFAVGASSSIQNLSKLIQNKEEVARSDIVFSESNVNDSHNINTLSIPPNLILSNINLYYEEMSLVTNKCIIFILPVRCIMGKTEDESIVSTVNECHKENAKKYGYPVIDVSECFNQIPDEWVRLLLPDPRHVNNAFMYNLGLNTSSYFLKGGFKFTQQPAYLESLIKINEYILITAEKMGEGDRKKNSMFEENTFELIEGKYFKLPKSSIGYSLIGIGTWSNGPSTIEIRNKGVTIVKSFNSLNAFNELIQPLVLGEDTSFTSKKGENTQTEKSVNVNLNTKANSCVLITCLLLKLNVNKDKHPIKVDINYTNVDYSFLIPNPEPYYRSILFFIQKTPINFLIDKKSISFNGDLGIYYSNCVRDAALFFSKKKSPIAYKLMRLAKFINPNNTYAINFLKRRIKDK